ncbi:Zn-dependent hydrolase [Pararhizobium gei]|uniref:Zn-dependent hydrolase n=1 Tax=Pararhizobium gei TaxID=1395951 RepID=UPI0023DAF292|nr:Zn-dependent hydrolase [Rhizobium gei]
MKPVVSINGQRLMQRLDEFAAIGGGDDLGVNRQALTKLDRQSRSILARIALRRDFEVFQDEIANLFVRRRGKNNTRAPFMIGSHLDTQPTGGRFDGALGTLAALEVLETLEDAGVETECPLEMVAWTNEEGSRFSPGSMGSQAFVKGVIPPEILAAQDGEGEPMARALADTLTALPEAQRRPLGGPLQGYLELHIEQGPILENEGIPIGVVTAVQGTRWLQVKVTGEAGHAGTTLAGSRRDPMRAATTGLAELYAAIMPADEEARLTVGRFSLEPGSINAVPAVALFSIDIRHPDPDRLDRIEATIGATLRQAAEANGCTVDIACILDMPSTMFAESLLTCIEQAAAENGVKHRRIVSRAFHDALFISRIAPAAMIFVPCRNGVSHNAAEFVEPEFCILGADMLLHATLRAVAELEDRPEIVTTATAEMAVSNA